jgi:hypothetical protein
MDRPSGTDEDAEMPGRRLERYIKARWTRRNGGILGLANAIGSSTETIYAWFRGDNEPSMAHLRSVADNLGVRRAVLVAVLDGDPLPGESPDLDARLRTLELTVERLAQRAIEAPSGPRVREGSAG